jgi:hypothetical protein
MDMEAPNNSSETPDADMAPVVARDGEENDNRHEPHHEQQQQQQQQEEEEDDEPARRLVKMREVLVRALVEIGAQVPLKTFADCFPDYAERRRADLKRARKDLLNQFKQNVIVSTVLSSLKDRRARDAFGLPLSRRLID